MIHHSVGAPRRVARVIAAVGGSLWAIIAGGLSNPASAGSAAPGLEPPLRGSYCEESEQDLARSRAGCARISGYITAGARFGPDERIGGRATFFAPPDEPGIAGGDVSGFKTIAAPPGGDPVLPRLSAGDNAR
jgi:hypothetical protein